VPLVLFFCNAQSLLMCISVCTCVYLCVCLLQSDNVFGDSGNGKNNNNYYD
jgi:amino acid permease